MVLLHGGGHLRPGRTGYWFAIRSELNHALDQGLRYRLIGLREFLEDVEPGGDEAIASRLDEISQLGELYQVFDADGALIAQSDGLARHGVPAAAAAGTSASRFATRRAARRGSRSGSPGRR